MRQVCYTALAIVLASYTGCGGPPSAASMKKYALRNVPDEPVKTADPPKARGQAPEAAVTAAAKAAPMEPLDFAPVATGLNGAGTPPIASSQLTSVPAPPPKEVNSKSIQNAKPLQPLSPAECRARSLANLGAIGKALAAYAAKHKRLPSQSINNLDGEKMLSWRVAILPELGYPALKASFRPHEPWDSPHNRQLLSQIPPEYQSPERFDTRTNYLGVAGMGMVLGTPGGLAIDKIKDGPDNTIAVMEVDDQHAHEWTRPVDFAVNLEEPNDGLGRLRGDGAFVLLASGRAVLVPLDFPHDQWAALYTPARGEPLVAAELLSLPTLEPASKETDSLQETLASKNSAGVTAPSSVVVTPHNPTLQVSAVDADKLPVPDEEVLSRSRELLKELYRDNYAAARTVPQLQEFAKKLIADAAKLDQNSADYYELLRVAAEIAGSIGDVTSAIAASKLLEQRFQFDPLPHRHRLLTTALKYAKGENASAILVEARVLLHESVVKDRYDLAFQLHDVALAAARLGASKLELNRLRDQREWLEQAQSAFEEQATALAALQVNSNDTSAHEQVGKYLCFVKNQWEQGLPHLAKSADIRLRIIASIDLSDGRSAHETLSLGDQYWELAARIKEPYKFGLHMRAVSCYQTAVAEIAGSLERIKAEKRIREANTYYGVNP